MPALFFGPGRRLAAPSDRRTVLRRAPHTLGPLPPRVVFSPTAFGGPGVRLAPQPRAARKTITRYLFPPVVVFGPAVDAIYPRGPGMQLVQPPRQARVTHSGLGVLHLEAAATGGYPQGPMVVLVQPPRQARVTHSELLQFSLAPPPLQPLANPLEIRLAASKRGAPKSRLQPPVVVGGSIAFSGPHVRLVVPRSTNPAVHSRLYIGPAVILGAASVLGGTSMSLVRIRPAATHSFLRPPSVAPAQVVYAPLSVHLVRTRAGRVHSQLRPPAVVAQTGIGEVRIHLAYSLRGAPKSRLQPPVVVVSTAVEFFGPEVTLAPQSRRPGRWHLGPMGAPAVVYAPLSVHLAYSLRGKSKSHLGPPVDIVDQAEIGAVRIHLAYSLRAKPKSRLAPPAVVFTAVELSGPQTTLAPQSRRPGRWLLRPMGPAAAVHAPIDVHLTYSRRGAPKSFLPQASPFTPIAKAETVLAVTLAYSVRGQSKHFLRTPTVVLSAAVSTPIQITLAPSRRQHGVALLRSPAAVGTAKSFEPTRVTLTRIRPRRVLTRLLPPAVVGVAVVYPPIFVHLVRIRPPRTMWHIVSPLVRTPHCYGCVVGDDSSPFMVCGEDAGPTVVGGDEAGATVSGFTSSDRASGVTGSRGSVSGGDERREGC